MVQECLINVRHRRREEEAMKRMKNNEITRKGLKGRTNENKRSFNLFFLTTQLSSGDSQILSSYSSCTYAQQDARGTSTDSISRGLISFMWTKRKLLQCVEEMPELPVIAEDSRNVSRNIPRIGHARDPFLCLWRTLSPAIDVFFSVSVHTKARKSYDQCWSYRYLFIIVAT